MYIFICLGWSGKFLIRLGFIVVKREVIVLIMILYDDNFNLDLLCLKKWNEMIFFYFKCVIKRYGKKGKCNEGNFFVLN